MDDPSTADAVVLHLQGVDREGSADGPAPLARSLPGIWAGLGVRTAAVGDRVAVLSALRDLADEGLVERRTGRVEELEGRRYVFALTDAGVDHATDLREEVADREVTVEHGDRRETVRLGDVDRVLDPPAGGAVRPSTPADNPVLFEDPVDTVADQQAWTLANAAGGTVRAGPRRVGDRFVDRGPELGRFGAVLDAAATGRTETVLVTGGAGAGKSSFLERATAVARERGFAVGVATATVDDPPYGPVLRALSGVSDPERVAEAFDRHAGHPVEDPGERRSRRAALAGELADLLRERAADGPVLLALDDLGDADRPSLAVLGDLADRLDDAPVVLTGVVDDTAGREGGLGEFLARLDDETRIPLDSFGGDDVAGVVAHLLSDPDPPASFVEGVADRSGGNPLLAAETVRYCLAVGGRDDADGADGHDRSGDADPSRDPFPDPREDVPGGVAGVVGRRIDGLPDPAVAVLEAAAVAGGAVHERTLAAAVDRPVPDLREWVDVLTGAGLLVRRAGGEVRVPGEAVREVALDRLDGERERTLHDRIAEAVEATTESGDGRSPAIPEGGLSRAVPGEALAATVAHHYRAADRPAEALDRTLAAADWAREGYAHCVAAEALETAADLAREVGDDGALIDALAALGDARAALADHDEALRHYAYVRERGDAGARRRAYRTASGVHHDAGDFDAAVDLARRGLDVDPPDGAPDAETVRLRIREGAALLERGDAGEAREAFQRALDAAGAVGDQSLRGTAHNRLGTAALHLGDAEGAIAAFERAVEAHRDTGRPAERATPLVNLGIVRRQLGDHRRAVESLEGARAALDGAGDPVHLAEVLRELGRTHEALGDERTAAERYEAALAAAERADAYLTVAAAAADLGGVRQSLGEYDAAREHLERSLAVAEEVGDDGTLAEVHNALSQLAAQQGDPEAAREHAESALSAARDAGEPGAVAYAMAQLGERAREDGDVDRAEECHREGLERARGVGAGGIAALNLVGLARDATERGQYDRAADRAEDAGALLGADAPPSLAVAVARIRADCDSGRGDPEGARERLEAALDAAADRPPLRAQLLADLAELAAERGEEGRSRELATEARDLAAEVGIEPVHERAADLLPDPD